MGALGAHPELILSSSMPIEVRNGPTMDASAPSDLASAHFERTISDARGASQFNFQVCRRHGRTAADALLLGTRPASMGKPDERTDTRCAPNAPTTLLLPDSASSAADRRRCGLFA